ncbi:MAG: dTDP-glucose 4,6-dehydratase [Bacteroidetes bacterium]|nr:dTDP-glucose 4,6-dehydratase [Bacteroidota bacterium]
MKNILITGGAGFIGSNFTHFMLEKYSDINIFNLDKLTYAANLENLKSIENNSRYNFIHGDICNSELVDKTLKENNIDTIVHFAAESHVDRSILGPEIFIHTNVLGTSVLLEAIRKLKISKLIHVSTDEVYGSLSQNGKFVETTPLNPTSPYSSSKASSDLIALSYFKTFDLPIIVTRCSNNYGPFQFPEKLIPLMIANALNDKKLPVYGEGKNIRDWLFVKDHCSAIDIVIQKGKNGEVYNIGGNNEWQNIDIIKLLLKILNKPESLIEFVKDRQAHDFRYAIDASKIKNELGWEPTYKFENGLEETIKWYLENEVWWKRIINGEYQKYYELQYSKR